MSRRNRKPLDERIARAAEAALETQHHVSAIDVLTGIGWLAHSAVSLWRQGRIDCLERELHIDAARLSEAMELFRAWAAAKGLSSSEAQYVARTPQRPTLRFSLDGDADIERAYRTHWVSPELSAAKRERLAEKVNRPPELVVVQPLNKDWTCHRCSGSGELLVMEEGGPVCLPCVGLGDLEFLPTGNALLTRRARKASARSAVVVRFSRSRRRYERQGLLVEAPALADVRREVLARLDTRAR